ncbi:F-box protein At1g67340-like [Malania oleifera]|uniref:F-box protein At1g67340-like n=1 Tax=Malania oleifera TaxID=397392 RepID=UPI0025AE9BF5|nr:F-box protein At1g67340-like [Malania oleifera]
MKQRDGFASNTHTHTSTLSSSSSSSTAIATTITSSTAAPKIESLQQLMVSRKKSRTILSRIPLKSDPFDQLPDDLVVCILCKLSSVAASPSDLLSVRITCKRLNRLGAYPLVLSSAGAGAFDIDAGKWSESAHRFLKQCVAAGNVEAYYTLGMIRFYCLENRESGASLMAKAAMRSHALAMYSLAVIHFNGSGGSKGAKDLRGGAALCARAAALGHVDALRELGHCLQDGYGVRQNVPAGRRLLVQANTRELAAVLRRLSPSFVNSLLTQQPDHHARLHHPGRRCPILSDYGCDLPVPEPHPANRFLVGWFGLRGGSPGPGPGLGLGLRLCCHGGCGRRETRANEFRRCSVCNKVNYCSRGCQALDWKMRHKEQCAPTDQREEEDEDVAG